MNVATRDEQQATTGGQDFLAQAGVIIPTYNAAQFWPRLHATLEQQGIVREQVLIVDSSSQDGTRDLVRQAGYGLKIIPKDSFRHGETRQMAANHLPGANLLIYMTQDAIPQDGDSLATLLQAFKDPTIGAAYGRQVAREQAGPIERHARLFNYPDRGELRDFSSHKQLGFRTAFFSNSFAAYRRTALEEIGGFKNTIVCEDMSAVAQMLLAGWRVRYVADAVAIHSHSLGVCEEFSRYFDTGVHHGRERWVIDRFGTVGQQGRAFVLSELRYLWAQRPGLIPLAAARNCSKWLSYKMGLYERYLPGFIKTAVSAQPNFWRDERDLRPEATSPKRLLAHSDTSHTE